MAKKNETDGEKPKPKVNGWGSVTINGDEENPIIFNADG